MAIISTATSGLAFGKTPIRVSFDLQTSTLTPNETNNRVVVCTVTTENIRNGEVLYYTITGVDITAEDFEDGLTGNFTINNNGGEFTLTVSTDLLTEGNETFVISLRRTSDLAAPVIASQQLSINDTSQDPTFTVTPNTNSIDEGGEVEFTVTTNAALPVTIYYTTSGTLDSSDFVNSGSGSTTIGASIPTRIIPIGIRSDWSTEGSESFALDIRRESLSGGIQTTSTTVTVNDVSVDPTYTVTTPSTTVTEGSTVNFTIYTNNPDPIGIYYTATPGTTSQEDFFDPVGFGTTTIGGDGSGSTIVIPIGIKSDWTTEGSETFSFKVRKDGYSGTILASSPTITVNDISIDPVYTITPSTTNVNEGEVVNFEVYTNNPDPISIAWTTGGSSSSDDYDNTIGYGTTTIGGNGSGSIVTFPIGIRSDWSTEEGGDETLFFQIRSADYQTVYATSGIVYISDTYLDPVFKVTTDAVSADEGSTVNFEIYTDNPTNIGIYYTVTSSTADRFDFDGEVLGFGVTTIGGNLGTSSIIPISIKSDVFTESSAEDFSMEIRADSYPGGILSTSSAVSINDTSQDPTFTVSFPDRFADEGETVSFIIDTDAAAPVGVAWTMYWSSSSQRISANDFVENTISGYATIGAGISSTITLTTKADAITDGMERFRVQLWRPDFDGTEVYETSQYQTVYDTSRYDGAYIQFKYHAYGADIGRMSIGSYTHSSSTSYSTSSETRYEFTYDLNADGSGVGIATTCMIGEQQTSATEDWKLCRVGPIPFTEGMFILYEPPATGELGDFAVADFKFMSPDYSTMLKGLSIDKGYYGWYTQRLSIINNNLYTSFTQLADYNGVYEGRWCAVYNQSSTSITDTVNTGPDTYPNAYPNTGGVSYSGAVLAYYEQSGVAGTAFSPHNGANGARLKLRNWMETYAMNISMF